MKRTRKIRGNKRKFRKIEQWVSMNKELDLDELDNYKREYCKVRIIPWGTRISLTNSIFPEPYGQLKQEIIKGLVDIYDCWKKKLDKLDKPYYLKIWLCIPHISKSQVVCAIDDQIDFYQNTFFNPKDYKKLNCNQFGSIGRQISEFEWEHRIDEDFIFESDFESDLDNDYLKYLNDKKKKAQRISELNFEFKEGVKDIAYGFKVGDLWLGSR
ncbi:hypothetical protein GCM10009118_27140 [Wandonia haliotis]|uniref:Uncharacterized protein n=1 Tax=Wandonia haliotis TaxID=574963 RepID=A0ABN1MSR9_9FLAO